jgi:hypothetical protein
MPARDEHVVRLDVAMHDAARVRVRERIHHIAQHAHRIAHRHLALARELRAQRLALDERHRIVEEIAGLAGREHRHDVRMLERCRELDLAAKALDVHTRSRLGREHFHHHASSERRLPGKEDVRHPTAAELPFDAVGITEGTLQPVDEI